MVARDRNVARFCANHTDEDGGGLGPAVAYQLSRQQELDQVHRLRELAAMARSLGGEPAYLEPPAGLPPAPAPPAELSEAQRAFEARREPPSESNSDQGALDVDAEVAAALEADWGEEEEEDDNDRPGLSWADMEDGCL